MIGGLFIVGIIVIPVLFATLIFAPGPLESEKTVVIERGSSTGSIGVQLANAGVIDQPMLFYIAVRLAHPGGLQAGEYKFKASANLSSIIYKLHKGRTEVRTLTIPEGHTVAEIIEQLRDEPTLGGLITQTPPEGSLLPETYRYAYGDGRNEFMQRMRDHMEKTLAELWRMRDPATPLKSPEEALIMASIVEKETGVAPERARVAGVFINRLKRGMPLQSDPTVIYALTRGQKPLDRGLTRADLAFASPYNTYVTPGLPPGPIANPGRAALEATLRPERHNYLYFVADGSGGHAFSETLGGHNDNVANWRKISAAARKKAKP